MTKTLILSHDTMRQLLEAHASMAAWYYQLTDALRAAGGQAEPPDEDKRRAFVAQLATHFPEVAEVARSIEQPRPYIPPPVFVAPAAVPPPAPPRGAGATSPVSAAAEPAAAPPPPPPVAAPPAAIPPVEPTDGQPGAGAAAGPDPVAPPPLVDPDKVRYD